MASGEIPNELEIAGSPRNSFRTSVGYEFYGGKALNGLGADKVTEL